MNKTLTPSLNFPHREANADLRAEVLRRLDGRPLTRLVEVTDYSYGGVNEVLNGRRRVTPAFEARIKAALDIIDPPAPTL